MQSKDPYTFARPETRQGILPVTCAVRFESKMLKQ